RDFLHVPGFDHALIQTLETAAKEDGTAAFGKLAHALLGKWGAARGQVDQRARCVSDRRQRVERGGGDIGAHDHAGTSAGGRVVHGAVAAEPVIANVVNVEAPNLVGERLA